MRNKKGMILIESLLFFMICTVLISALVGFLFLTTKMYTMERDGYQDEELQALYME